MLKIIRMLELQNHSEDIRIYNKQNKEYETRPVGDSSGREPSVSVCPCYVGRPQTIMT